VAKYSLKPVAERLSQLLDRPVEMAPDCIGSEVEKMVGR
jgi:phosphoglycerate kinase